MFPRGAHPTHIGETDRPVRPRGRLDEGSGTPFWVMNLSFRRYPSRSLRRAPRCLLGVSERLLDFLPKENLAETLPDGVLHRGIVRVFGWDQRRFLRLLQHPPSSLGQRARLGLGASVPQRVASRRERPQPRLERLRLPRGEKTQQLECRPTVAHRSGYREGV